MDTDELRQLIVQKRELLARETFSRRAFNRCENMSDEMKNRYVEYLIERLENAELDNRAMKLVLEDLTKELSRSNQMLEKPPQAVPIETIIETKFDLTLEYHCLRKNGSILGETIFDEGAAILWRRNSP